jgi:hypothetical protein
LYTGFAFSGQFAGSLSPPFPLQSHSKVVQFFSGSILSERVFVLEIQSLSIYACLFSDTILEAKRKRMVFSFSYEEVFNNFTKDSIEGSILVIPRSSTDGQSVIMP